MATRYNYTGNIVTQGLVLNLDAAKTDSYPGTGTTWRDLSGFNNNGTLTNGPTFSGLGKQASIVFDGTNDYVNFNFDTSIITSTNQLTFNIWFQYTTSSQDTSLLEIGGYYNNWSLYWDGVNKTLLTFSITGNYSNRITSTTNTRTGGWFNAVGTYSPTSTNIYINSVLEKTALSQTLLNQTGIKEGRIANDSLNNTMKGSVSLVQIYNRALTQAEITQNFNALRGRYGI